MKLFFMFVFVASVFSQNNFCEFFCVCGFHNVTCIGVSVFPVFPTTEWIQALSILKSDLSFIPDFTEFQYASLSAISFQECPSLECDDIEHFLIQRPNVHVYSDLICTETTQPFSDTTALLFESTEAHTHEENSMEIEVITRESEVENEKNDHVAEIAITLACVCLVLIVVILACIYYQKKRNMRSRVRNFELDFELGIANESAV